MVEVGVDTGESVVLTDNVGTGRKRLLDVRLGHETLEDGILGEEASSQHDIRVGCVSAGSDSTDNDITVVESVLFAFIFEFGGALGFFTLKSETLEANIVSHANVEVFLHVSEVDAIVGTLGTGEGTLNSGEVKFHDFTGVVRVGLGAVIGDKHVLLAQVLLDKLNVTFFAASQTQVLNSALIDGEVAHSGTVLGSHVGNSGTISQVKAADTRAKEFNELANDTALTEHLDASEHQVSSGSALRKFILKMETDDLGKHHGDGLAEHDGFGLNATDTPTGNAETIDHGSVRVSADDGVGVEETVAVESNASKVLQVDLMNDTRAGRNNLEVVKGTSAPLEELEAFAITLEFKNLVLFFGISSARNIDLNGVINNEINGAKRVNLRWVTTKASHSITHGSQVDNSRHTSEKIKRQKLVMNERLTKLFKKMRFLINLSS